MNRADDCPTSLSQGLEQVDALEAATTVQSTEGTKDKAHWIIHADSIIINLCRNMQK